MLQFPQSTLWLGHAGDARDVEKLFENDIQAVVDLAFEEEPARLPRQLIYCRCPLVDGDGNRHEELVFARETVVALIKREIPTLLACSAGLSRSPTVAAFALSKLRNQSPDAMIQQIRELKAIDINPTLWSDMSRASD